MELLVLIKAVPASAAGFDTVATPSERIPNPADISALEAALRLRDQHGGRVTVMSMGPESCDSMLRQAVARGADRAVLVTDPDFAGADTAASSRVLAAAVKHLGGFDLILCGRKTTDGETGQVGPELAARLNLPCATNCTALSLVEETVQCDCLCTEGMQRLSMPMPAVLSIVYGINSPRLPSIKGLRAAKRAVVVRLDRNALELPREQCGQAGSPTVVVRIQRKDFEKRRPAYCDSARLDLLAEQLRRWIPC